MISSVSSELDIFLHYCNEAYVEKIVEFTNSYQQYVVRHIDIKLHSRLKNWYPVTVPEMYTFFAVCMLMTRNSRNTIEEHWSTNPYLHSGIYGSLMSRNRFCTILGMLHFCQPGPRTEEETILSKIIYPVNHARQTFKNSFIPYEKICIDESIVPFKGRLLIKQYLPKKRNRFGIKLFVLCDVLSGIILDFIVYCGKDTELTHFDNLGASGSVVATLLEEYYGVNRKLYIDNWYSSPKLSIFLKQRSIHTCGTVKPNRSEMPKFKNLKKGDREALYSDPIMAMKWRDKKNIHMLTTIHKDEMGPTEKMDLMTGLPKLKPECIIDYNKNMGAVDVCDMMLSGLQCIRKTIKWYKKLFFHILDLHLLNSYHIFKITCKDDFSPSFRKYQLVLIEQLVQKYGEQSVHKTLPSTSRALEQPTRFLPGDGARHMPSYVPKQKKLRCKLCARSKKRRTTRYMCAVCTVALCVVPCFQLYHKKK
nr:unnamed protein product [Amyelois transitella]